MCQLTEQTGRIVLIEIDISNLPSNFDFNEVTDEISVLVQNITQAQLVGTRELATYETDASL